MNLISSSLAILVLLTTSVVGAPATLHPVQGFAGETTGRYLVTLKPGIGKSGLVNQIKRNATVTHQWDLVNGFAAHLDEDTLNNLRANPDVESISEDGIVHTTITQ